MSEGRERKVRRDKGSRLMNSRDEHVLPWIAEQYAVRFDHVQQLLSVEPGHHCSSFAPGSGGISDSGVLQVISRWERDPMWAQYRRFYVDLPGWIWLTNYGIEVLHNRGFIPAYGRHTLRESSLDHLHWINCVRLNYSRRHPEFRWVSERTLRKALGRRDERSTIAHIPDAQLWLDEHRAVAVEIELSPKSDQEYDKIMDELLITGVALPDRTAFTYNTLWYFVSSANDVHVQARRRVKAACERLGEKYSRRVQIIDLEELVQREHATTSSPISN